MNDSYIFQQIQYVMYFNLLCGILLQWNAKSRNWPNNKFNTFLGHFYRIYYITMITGAVIIIGLPGKGFLALLETTIYYGCVLALGQFMFLMGLSIAELVFKKNASS